MCVSTKVGMCPLTLKLRRLKLRMESKPNGNTSILKRNTHLEREKKRYSLSGDLIKAYLAKLLWNTFTGHMMYNKESHDAPNMRNF